MAIAELSAAVHELKWIRDLCGGSQSEGRTRSSIRGGGLSISISTTGNYFQATLKRLKNMPVLSQFRKFAEHSKNPLDPPQTSA